MPQLLKFLLVLLFLSSNTSFSTTKGIGIILSNSKNNYLLDNLKKELYIGFKNDTKIPPIIEVAYSEKENLNTIISNFEKNSKIDTIFILDYQITNFDFLKKSSKLIIYPFGIEASTKKHNKNFIYIHSKPNITSDLNKLNKIVNLKKITLIIDNISLKDSSKEILQLEKYTKEKNIKLDFFNNSNDLISIKKSLETSDALYLVSNSKATSNLISLALEKKVSTFLIAFSKEPNKNTLMGYNLDFEIKKRIRTGVFNLYNNSNSKRKNQIFNLGILTGDIYYNLEVGNKLGILPSVIALKNLELIQKVTPTSKKISIRQALKIGIDNNPLLNSKFKKVIANNYSYRSKNSKRLPKVSLTADYSYLDKRVVNPISGPEDRIVGGLTITQVIFDNELNAEIFSEKMTSKNTGLEFQEQLKNTTYEILVAYVSVLESQSHYKIQLDNFNLAKELLRVSKIKYESGATGIQDIYRLESSLSTSTTSLSNAETIFNNNVFQLNTLLNIPINTRHSYQSLEELNKEFAFIKIKLDKVLYSAEENNKILNILTKGAINNSNILKSYSNTVQSLNTQYNAVAYSRIIPKISAFGQYSKNNMIEPWGEGSDYNEPNNWRAGVSFSIPIFSSGETYFDQESLKASKESLIYEKKNYENLLSQEINTGYNNLKDNFIKINGSKISANLANKYLKISKNLYANGSINITEILDAQNTSFSTNLSNSIDNYNFLISLFKLEKAYGKFFLLKNNKNIENKSL